MLALSATSFTDKMVFEKEFLKKHKFRCIDSKISGAIDPNTVTNGVSLEEFFTRSAGYAKMIYDTDSNSISQQFTLTDCRDLARLKQLTKDDVLLITQPELARGVDYRACNDDNDT